VPKGLATLLLTVMWEKESEPNNLMDLVGEIFRQNVENDNWLLLGTCDKL
jgi:hypothetical protein